MARKLRITASVFFAVVTVALCALWVRSYWRMGTVSAGLTDSSYFLIDSVQGRCNGGIVFISPGQETPFEFTTIELEDDRPFFDASNSTLGFELWEVDNDFDSVGGMVPYWFLVALTAASIAIPWLDGRFSLRTLLIAMTLVAVLLGFGFWLAS